GGKSAGIVFRDADLELAVRNTLLGIFTNAGQICSAASRLLVHRSVHQEMLERLEDAVRRLSIGPGVEDADVTPLISRQQLERVEAFCVAAEREGARRVVGGRRTERDGGYFMAPSVYCEVSRLSALAREE